MQITITSPYLNRWAENFFRLFNLEQTAESVKRTHWDDASGTTPISRAYDAWNHEVSVRDEYFAQLRQKYNQKRRMVRQRTEINLGVGTRQSRINTSYGNIHAQRTSALNKVGKLIAACVSKHPKITDEHRWSAASQLRTFALTAGQILSRFDVDRLSAAPVYSAMNRDTQADRCPQSKKDLAFFSEPWFNKTDYLAHRGVHKAHSNPSMLAFYRSFDHFLKDRQTIVKPGKYLKEFYGHVLSDAEIKSWSEKIAAVNAPLTMHLLDNNDPKWADNADGLRTEWVRLYDEVQVDYSCMKGSDCVEVYGVPGNGLGLMYWEDPADGTLLMRTIVNTQSKQYVRCYPASEAHPKGLGEEALQQLVVSLGYASSNRRALAGAKLHKLHKLPYDDSDDQYVMPYLDGGMSVEESDCGRYFIASLTGDCDCSNTVGFVRFDEGQECGCCGSRMRRNSGTYIEREEIEVCDSCLENNYVFAYGRRRQDHYPIDDCIYCESDGEWYVGDYAGDYHSVHQCEVSGNWYHADDLVATSRGFIHHDEARALDHDDDEGHSYAHPRDVKELSDGTTCHRGNFEALQEELDAEEASEDDEPVEVVAIEPTEHLSPVAVAA